MIDPASLRAMLHDDAPWIRMQSIADHWPEEIGVKNIELLYKWAAILHDDIRPLLDEVERLREALEPFALISSEGVVKQETGHVSITTCAEYFHRARLALQKDPA